MKIRNTLLAGALLALAAAGAVPFLSAQNGTSNQNVYDVLRNDHRRIQDMFSQLLRGNTRSDDTFAQIQNALDAHMNAEERYFYPVLERDNRARTDVLEAYEEHSAAKDEINKVDESSNDAQWMARVKVLSDMVNHHIRYEESKVFSDARKVLSKQQAQDIGRDIQDELNRAPR